MSAFVRSSRSLIHAKNLWNDLDQLSREVQPVDVGIGCPDMGVPSKVKQDLIDVVDGPDFIFHQYTKGFGHPRLVKALSKMYAPIFGRDNLDPSTEVIITNGATEALFISLMGLVNAGDEVIIIEPFFDCYVPQVKMAGGIPVFVTLHPSSRMQCAGDWELDRKELEAAFNKNTKAIVLNTPHNPTGKVFSRTELEQIASLCCTYGAVVISDEVYEWLVHDDQQHIRIASMPGMWERTISIGSAGKTFSVTGWRTGWAIGPANLLKGPGYIHQNSGYIICTPIQEALARSFERESQLLLDSPHDCFFRQLQQECEQKRDRLISALAAAGLYPIVPQGGYCILVDVRDIMSKVQVGGDPNEPRDFRFVKWLSRNKKLQVFPPSAFFSDGHKAIGENYVRFCFYKDDKTLDKAIAILQKLTTDL